MMSLYVHQNYTQFCDEIEHADDLMDSLSISDIFLSGVGEMVSVSTVVLFLGMLTSRQKVDTSRDVLPVFVQYHDRRCLGLPAKPSRPSQSKDDQI